MTDIDMVLADPVRLHRLIEYVREQDPAAVRPLIAELVRTVLGKPSGPIVNASIGSFYSSYRVFGVELFQEPSGTFLCERQVLPEVSRFASEHPAAKRIALWVVSPGWAQLSGGVYAHVAVPDPGNMITIPSGNDDPPEVHPSPYYDATWPETFIDRSGDLHSVFYEAGPFCGVDACLPDEDVDDNAAAFLRAGLQMIDLVLNGDAATLLTPSFDGVGLKYLLRGLESEQVNTDQFSVCDCSALLAFLLHDPTRATRDLWNTWNSRAESLQNDLAPFALDPLRAMDFASSDTVISFAGNDRARYFTAAEMIRDAVIELATTHKGELRSLLQEVKKSVGNVEYRSREEMYLPDVDLDPEATVEELQEYLAVNGARNERDDFGTLCRIMDAPWERESDEHERSRGEDLVRCIADQAGRELAPRMRRSAYRPTREFVAAVRRYFDANLDDYDENYGGYCTLVLKPRGGTAAEERRFEIKAPAHLSRSAQDDDTGLARFVRVLRSRSQ